MTYEESPDYQTTNNRAVRCNKLVDLLTEALEVYNLLMDDADGPIDRENWKIDRNDVERAMIFARNGGQVA